MKMKYLTLLLVLCLLCGCKKSNSNAIGEIVVEDEVVTPEMREGIATFSDSEVSDVFKNIQKHISGYNIVNAFRSDYTGGSTYYAQFQDIDHGLDITIISYNDTENMHTYYAEQVKKYRTDNIFNSVTERDNVTFLSNSNNLACLITYTEDTLVVYTYSLEYTSNEDAYDFYNKLRG